MRWVEENTLHTRRRYNGVFVFESILAADIHKAPVGVTYFYANGVTLIEYKRGWYRVMAEHR